MARNVCKTGQNSLNSCLTTEIWVVVVSRELILSSRPCASILKSVSALTQQICFLSIGKRVISLTKCREHNPICGVLSVLPQIQMGFEPSFRFYNVGVSPFCSSCPFMSKFFHKPIKPLHFTETYKNFKTFPASRGKEHNVLLLEYLDFPPHPKCWLEFYRKPHGCLAEAPMTS